MAKRPGRPALPSTELLPQRFDVWQVDARPLPEVQVAGKTTTPWAVVVASLSDGSILGLRLAEEPPGATEVWEMLTETMLTPDTGEPHRPSEVQFLSEEWADTLRPRLDELGIPCDVVEELEVIDHVVAFLGDKMSGGEQQTSLLDVEGMTPEMIGSFFDAAAIYHEQEPWKKVGERPICIECERFEGGPWYAVLMGQGGMTSGLALYDSLEMLERIQQGDLSPEELAGITSGWAVVFGDKEELSDNDAEAVQSHGWRVNGPQAYPTVYHTDPGLQMRPPTPEELHLLEACLRAVPEFVRKKTRRVETAIICVPTAVGEATMLLSWVEW